MLEVTKFNQSVSEAQEDKVQYNFNVKFRKGRNAMKRQDEDVFDGIRQAVNSFYTQLKDSCDCRPMTQEEFEGIKYGEMLEYSKETVIGFPFRIGILSYVVGQTKFFKLGIIIQKYKI